MTASIQRGYPAIDIWTNLMTEPAMTRIAGSVVQETAELFDKPGLFRDAGCSPRQFIKQMDAVGVELTLIPSLKFGGQDHSGNELHIPESAVADVCREHPDRFRGLFGIDPHEGMEGVRELEAAVKEKRFVGAHIVPYGFHLPPNHRRYYPFYTKCVELDVPVMIQVGHTAVRMPNDPGRPGYLDDVVLEFPELDVVAANAGWPWTEELIALAWTHGNVYIGTTGHAPQYWDEELIRFTRTRGRDKVLWGTNYPVVDPEESLEQIDSLNLTSDTEHALLNENARRVFGV